MILPRVSKSFSPKKSASPSKTSPERIVWMGRTSDIFGTFVDPNLADSKKLDASLNLIRSKIQERCHNTQELMNHIRRIKLGPTRFVNASEFRAFLLKFGINISQSLIDQVFSTFDYEKTGLMDFDNFAVWVMNAEFHSKSKSPDSITNIRHKLVAAANQNPSLFSHMRDKVTLPELITEFNRKNVNKISNSDLEAIFSHLEKKDKPGVLETATLASFAGIANYDSIYHNPFPNTNQEAANILEIEQAVYKICGTNRGLLEQCFSHIPKGQNIRLTFEDFRHVMVRSGLGLYLRYSQALFVSLGPTHLPTVRIVYFIIGSVSCPVYVGRSWCSL